MGNATFPVLIIKRCSLSLSLSRQLSGTTGTGRTFTDATSQCVSVPFNVICAVKKENINKHNTKPLLNT